MKSVFEKIIERLEEDREVLYECLNGETEKDAANQIVALNAAIKIVNQVAEEYRDGWIPCSRELPPQPKENPLFENRPLEIYLVSARGEDIPFRAFWNGKFFADEWGEVEVIAWRPLPAPYQPKRSAK